MIPYYDRDGITIYCGETLEVMTYLYKLLQLIFDAIMADLPYGTTACAWDTIIPFEPLWENYKRLIKSNGAVVLFGSEPFSSLLRLSNLEWYKYDWVWKKSKGANFVHAKNMPIKFDEDIVIFSPASIGHESQLRSDRMVYNPQDLIKIDKVWTRPKKYESEHKLKRASHKLSRIIEYENYPTSIIKIGNSDNSERGLHPTQKPVALLAYLIRTYTNPGEIVLDNTMGSGTTLVAAQREGRRAIGIDISEDYCKIAVDRLRQPSFFRYPISPKIRR